MGQGLLGGIPGFDPAEFQVSDEERKRLLLGNILLGISAGAFNSNKGNQIGALGSGMLQGAQMGQRALSDAQAAKMDKLKAASGFMEFAGKKQAYKDDMAYRDALATLPTGEVAPPDGVGPPALSSGSPYQRAIAELNYLQGRKVAPKYLEAAQKKVESLRPELKETRTQLMNGQPVTVNYFKDGTHEVVPYAPAPELRFFETAQGQQGVNPLTGQPQGSALPNSVKGQLVDGGGSNQFVNPYNQQTMGQRFSKSMTPYESAMLPIHQGGLQLQQQKFLAEQGKTAESEEKKKQGQIATADLVMGKVDEAIKDVGYFSTGATGATLGKIPGTTAYNLRSTAETIKANLGFDRLQQMRDASPTGGALGQVAVQELSALQASVANLDPNQGEAQLTRNLQQIKKHYDNWKKAAMGGEMPDPLGLRK